MLNFNIMNSIKRIVIFSLILVLGLGFFVGQTPVAEAIDYFHVGSTPYPIRDIAFLNITNKYYGGVSADQTFFVADDLYYFKGLAGTTNSRYSVGINLENHDECWSTTTDWYCDPKIYSAVQGPDVDVVYIVGNFTHVNGLARDGIAAVNIRTQEVISWNPDTLEGNFSSIELSPDGENVYILSYVSSAAHDSGYPWHHVIYKIDSSSGDVIRTWEPEEFSGYFNSSRFAGWYLRNLILGPDGDKAYVIFAQGYSQGARYADYEYLIIEIDTQTGTTRKIDIGKELYGRVVLDPSGEKLYAVTRDSTDNKYITSYYLDVGSVSHLRLTGDVPHTLLSDELVISPNGNYFLFYPQAGNDYLLGDFSNGRIKAIDTSFFKYRGVTEFSRDNNYIYLTGLLHENYDETIAPKRIGDVVSISLTSVLNDDPNLDDDIVYLDEYESLTGVLVKEKDSPIVYLLRNGIKYPIQSAEVFESHGWRWEDIVTYVSLSNYPTGAMIGAPAASDLETGSLVKTLSSSKVYIIVSGKKHWVTSEYLFNGLGYSWHNIKNISDTDLNSYTTGKDITTLNHPEGSLIKYGNYPTVYLIENDTKRAFASESAFLGRGYHWNQIIDARADVTYPDGALIQ